jgi:hypothetical protein
MSSKTSISIPAEEHAVPVASKAAAAAAAAARINCG